jgi:hypothetical protein
MAENKPRDPEDQEYTGAGTSRSADLPSTSEPRPADNVDPAIVVGAHSSSHPAEADDLAVNRSGSGGSGDEQNDEPDAG